MGSTDNPLNSILRKLGADPSAIGQMSNERKAKKIRIRIEKGGVPGDLTDDEKAALVAIGIDPDTGAAGASKAEDATTDKDAGETPAVKSPKKKGRKSAPKSAAVKVVKKKTEPKKKAPASDGEKKERRSILAVFKAEWEGRTVMDRKQFVDSVTDKSCVGVRGAVQNYISLAKTDAKFFGFKLEEVKDADGNKVLKKVS